MHNSALINIYMTDQAARLGVPRYFLLVPRWRLPRHAARRARDDGSGAVPAHPDNEYGWRSCTRSGSPRRTSGDTGCRCASRASRTATGRRDLDGGREKAPAAMCRKNRRDRRRGTIDVWGDGSAVRSYTLRQRHGRRDLRADALGVATARVNIGCPQYVTVTNWRTRRPGWPASASTSATSTDRWESTRGTSATRASTPSAGRRR